MDHDHGPERFLSWRQVHDLTGLGRTTAWRLRQAGAFPEPAPISPGRVAWRARDIAAWIESRGAPARLHPAAAARSALGGMVAVRPSQRRPIPALALNADPAPRCGHANANAKSASRRGRRPVIAEGQLGFDF